MFTQAQKKYLTVIKMKKKDINRYMNLVKNELYCSFNMKRAFLAELKSRIYEYLENNSNANIDEIENYFGHPKVIALTIQDSNVESLKKKVKKYLIIEILAVLMLLFSIGIIIFLVYQHGGTIIVN